MAAGHLFHPFYTHAKNLKCTQVCKCHECKIDWMYLILTVRALWDSKFFDVSSDDE